MLFVVLRLIARHTRQPHVLAALKRLGAPHDRIAEAINRDRTAATKMMNGTRAIKHEELPALSALVAALARTLRCAGVSEIAL